MDAKKPLILLIDDDPDVHSAVELMLAGLDYELVCYRTGASGLLAIRQRRPDLVLLDIMLCQPTEGLQVACEMRQDPRLREIPIVLISAIAASSGAEYAREVCPVDLAAELFLEKPLEASRVREAVQWVLAQRRSAEGPPAR